MNGAGQPVYVGRECGGRELSLDRELVSAYCEALRSELPIYQSTVPGLALHSECYRDFDWYLANIFGNLHARQEWELFEEAPVGSPVVTRSFVRDRYRKRGRDYVVKETWVMSPAGRLINRGITHQSFLVEGDGGRPAGEVVDKGREKQAGRSFQLDSDGLAEFAPLERTVDESMCRLFSGPGRNYHTDREEARKLGFPDIVVQGMLPVCLLSELMTREFGRGWLAGGKMDVRLVNVLWAGESVAARAAVTRETPEAGRTRVSMQAWVEKADGTKVIVGQAGAIR